MFKVRTLVDTDPGWKEEGDAFATNCDTEGCERSPNILMDPLTKMPMEYTCQEALRGIRTSTSTTTSTNSSVLYSEAESFSETVVSVDYEAMLPFESDQADNERQLQWRVLLAAVEEVGLDRCNFEKQREPSSAVPSPRSSGISYRRPLVGADQEEGLDPSLIIYAIQNDFESSKAFSLRTYHLMTCHSVRLLYALRLWLTPLCDQPASI
jgi:hypothetical protein